MNHIKKFNENQELPEGFEIESQDTIEGLSKNDLYKAAKEYAGMFNEKYQSAIRRGFIAGAGWKKINT